MQGAVAAVVVVLEVTGAELGVLEMGAGGTPHRQQMLEGARQGVGGWQGGWQPGGVGGEERRWQGPGGGGKMTAAMMMEAGMGLSLGRSGGALQLSPPPGRACLTLARAAQ